MFKSCLPCQLNPISKTEPTGRQSVSLYRLPIYLGAGGRETQSRSCPSRGESHGRSVNKSIHLQAASRQDVPRGLCCLSSLNPGAGAVDRVMTSVPSSMPEFKPHVRALILLVEDETLVRMMLADVLDDAGFKVMEAAHADEALRVLALNPDIQVVVTDVEMPLGSINGFDLARRVREDRQDTGVVIASGRVAPQPGDLPQGTYFLGKPICAETLVELIRTLVREG